MPKTIFTIALAWAAALHPLPASAQALTSAPAVAVAAAATACSGPAGGAQVAAQVGARKTEAILGGVSQLELLRRQQASAAPARQLAVAAAVVNDRAAIAGSLPVPGSGEGGCARLALPSAVGAQMRPGRGTGAFGADDFLASRRLPVSRTSFDADWNRVRAAALPSGTVASLTRLAPGANGEALLGAVNAYANRRVRYVSDDQLYGRPDYWANAGATLARGAGDCEDIAIVKLQLLAAAGVPRSDMYLTIARDLVRKVDHAVLVVRHGGRHWLLDNSTDRVVDAGAANDYRPIFSYSGDRRWLHGY